VLPPAHARSQQWKILDRPDVRVPLEELAFVPDQAIELGGIVRTEAAPEDELLRRRDGRDRIDLEEAQAVNCLEDVAGGAVEKLRADSDPACLLESDDARADAQSLEAPTE
jgi:hypothetical protein